MSQGDNRFVTKPAFIARVLVSDPTFKALRSKTKLQLAASTDLVAPLSDKSAVSPIISNAWGRSTNSVDLLDEADSYALAGNGNRFATSLF